MSGKQTKFYCFYINPDIDLEFFSKCLLKSIKQNSLFSYDDKNKRIYFCSRYKEKIEFAFSPKVLDVCNIDFYNKVLEIINISHEKATLLKTIYINEPTDCSLQHKGKLEGLVHSAITKIYYEKFGILDFVSYIVFRIATKQIWKNANKRTAIVVAANLFEIFGLYIVFRNNQENYLEHWRQFMISIGERYENFRQNKNINDNEEKLFSDIKDKFSKSLYLDAKCIK